MHCVKQGAGDREGEFDSTDMNFAGPSDSVSWGNLTVLTSHPRPCGLRSGSRLAVVA